MTERTQVDTEHGSPSDSLAPELAGAIYQALASRRLGYDTLMWQVPATSFTAQAFLFTTALGSDGPLPRLVSAFLALVIALISMQLMSKHRYSEEVDSRVLEAFEHEFRLDAALGFAPHGPPAQRLEGLKARADMRSDIHPVKPNWVVRRSSYWLWQYGLGLFAFASIGIIATTLINMAGGLPALLTALSHVRLP